jgi:hypothetical protein
LPLFFKGPEDQKSGRKTREGFFTSLRNASTLKKTNLKSNLFLPFWGLTGKDFGSHNLSTAGSRFMLTEKIFF